MTRQKSNEKPTQLNELAKQKMLHENNDDTINNEAIADYDEVEIESTHFYEAIDYKQIQKNVNPISLEEIKLRTTNEGEYENIKMPKEE